MRLQGNHHERCEPRATPAARFFGGGRGKISGQRRETGQRGLASLSQVCVAARIATTQRPSRPQNMYSRPLGCGQTGALARGRSVWSTGARAGFFMRRALCTGRGGGYPLLPTSGRVGVTWEMNGPLSPASRFMDEPTRDPMERGVTLLSRRARVPPANRLRPTSDPPLVGGAEISATGQRAL